MLRKKVKILKRKEKIRQKTLSFVFFLVVVGIMFAGCLNVEVKDVGLVDILGTNNNSGLKGGEDVNQEGLSIMPVSGEAWIGDPMPFYDGEKFRVFFLEDQRRQGGGGYHPWGLITTKNFYEYNYEGIVIPYEVNAQDNALGTGSVVKDKNGLYHSFYTGHNDFGTPKEAIMHAVSRDMTTWNKIPQDTFFAGDEYYKDDFRDPYVFYNDAESKYWMLITTRSGNMGVIVKYTSDDLKSWNNEGVLFRNDMGSDGNMECPTLIKYGHYWYLSFSDQWPLRVVHYRIATNPNGPFIKPKVDFFDGNGFYAGRMEKDEENLYMFGWTPTRIDYNDTKGYDWAGSLVVHKLRQEENGELFAEPIKNITDKINNEINPVPTIKTGLVSINNADYQMSGKGLELVEFGEIEGINKITGKIKITSTENKFGFMFGIKDDNTGKVNIIINPKMNQIEVYNVATNEVQFRVPQSKMTMDMRGVDTFDFTILIDNSVATMYVNGKAAISARIFSMQGKKWGIFSNKNGVKFENIKMFK